MMLDRQDRYTLASVVAGLAVWWIFIGQKKYGFKGMTKNG
jgi:hypothetical protein